MTPSNTIYFVQFFAKACRSVTCVYMCDSVPVSLSYLVYLSVYVFVCQELSKTGDRHVNVVALLECKVTESASYLLIELSVSAV